MNTTYALTHARIVTMTDDCLGILDDGALLVRDGRIAWIGPSAKLDGDVSTVIDAQGRCVTPGLIDCHTHLLFAGCRTNEFQMRLAGESYTQIAAAGGGIQSTVTATRAASSDELFAIGRDRLKQSLRSGVTTLEIKSGYGLTGDDEEKMLRVARELGDTQPIQIHTTFLGAHTVPMEYKGRADDYIDHLIDDVLPRLTQQGLIDSVDAFCERIAFSYDQVDRMFARAQSLQLPVRLHADQLSDSRGAELAARYRALSADHLEHASESGITALKESGTVAVLLPGAFYYLRETTRPPVQQLRAAGVPMAIATDFNPGTSPMNCLPLAMNMACVLFGLSPAEAWLGATRYAARALNCLDDRGTLEVSKRADLALWEVEDPNTVIERMGFGLLSRLWIDGKPVEFAS